MFFEDLKGNVYEYHEPKYIYENGEEYIDGGNKIVKDVFVTSDNKENDVYYVELNYNNDKVFITKEVFEKLEECLQDTIGNIIDDNSGLYYNEKNNIYAIVKEHSYNNYDFDEDFYYTCDRSAEEIYSCNLIKFTYYWLEENKALKVKIKYLTNRIKELEEELECEKAEKEEWHEKWDDQREYKLKCTMNGWLTRDEAGVQKIFFSVEDVEYIDVSECIKKINKKIKSENNVYEITYFKINNQILTPEYLKNEIQNKRIPMYRGIPFRKLQDLYRIMEFLESEKNIDYKKEVNHIEFINKMIFKDKSIYFNNIKIKDDVIKRSIKHKDEVFVLDNVPIKLYSVRNILCFNNKEFKTVRDLMRLIKEKCYKDKELLISVIDNL